jgi:hypothetical protein
MHVAACDYPLQAPSSVATTSPLEQGQVVAAFLDEDRRAGAAIFRPASR